MVYNYIIGKIKSKEWEPGSKISTEKELCEELDVSRIAVRQAIEKLSALSILYKIQGSGTYVGEYQKLFFMQMPFYNISKENAVTILEFRRMFDSYNAELFVNKCNENDIKSLEVNFENMKNSIHDKKMFRYYDNEFHDLIAKGTRNEMIIQISNIFVDLLLDFQSKIYSETGPESAIEQHELILNNIRIKNAELASIYSRIHVENILKIVRASMDNEKHDE